MTSILILSDLHIGSTVALCKPSNQLDDGGTYLASTGQHWLHRCWEDMTERVWRNRRGDLYIVVNGDAVEGDLKRRSAQLISRRAFDLAPIALLAKHPDGFFYQLSHAPPFASSLGLEPLSQIRVDPGMDKDALPVVGGPAGLGFIFHVISLPVFAHRRGPWWLEVNQGDFYAVALIFPGLNVFAVPGFAVLDCTPGIIIVDCSNLFEGFPCFHILD
jgi:hypothetical protein